LQMRITQCPSWLTGKLNGLMVKMFNLCRKQTLKMSRKVRNVNVYVLETNSSVLLQGFTHPRTLVPRASAFWMVATYVFSIMFAFLFLHTKIFVSSHGSSGPLLAPSMWRKLLNFRKIREPLYKGKSYKKLTS
jgi:hypothetical protein